MMALRIVMTVLLGIRVEMSSGRFEIQPCERLLVDVEAMFARY